MIFLLIAFHGSEAAQSNVAAPLFESWTTKEGLPQNSVLNIAQTPDGYLWMTTTDGLARFDGVRFKTFKRSNTPVFPTNRLRILFVDEYGVLWILTENSKFVIRYSEGEFKVYERGVDFESDDPREPFRAEQRMRFRHGDVEYVFRDGQFKKEAFDPAFHRRAIAADFKNRWILAGGKYFVFGEDDTPREVSGDSAPLETDKEIKTVNSVELDSGRWFLFQVRNYSLLCRFKDGSLQASSYEFDYRSVLGADRDGNLWIGGYDEQLVRVAVGAQTVSDITDLKVEIVFGKNSGVYGRVSSVFRDRDQNLWIGTARGLQLLKDRPLVRVISKSSGLPSENIYAVTEDREGTIWFGAWDSSLGSYNRGNLVSEEVKLVSSLMVDDAGRLWTGYNYGVQYREQGRWQKVLDIQRDLKDGNSTFLFQDSKGAVWVGSTKALLRYSKGEIRHFTVADGLPGEHATAILESRSGAFWVGTATGLAKYENGSWTSFSEQDGLSSGFIRALYEDEEGVLWIGTYGSGLIRYKDGVFRSIQSKDGLHGDGVFCILEDSGWLWMSNNQGIFRVRRDELNSFADGKSNLVYSASYGPGEGLENVEANGGRLPAGIKSSDGRLWFATAGGLAVIDPKEAHGQSDPPPALIEEITIDQNKTFESASEILVNPSQRSVEINYTAFDFMYAKDIRFRYMLEGLDDSWTNAGNRRTAYFSHLPYGEYVFRVAAANRNGVWDDTGASVKIVVARPFYRTYWFYSLLALFTVGAFAAIYFYRVRQLEALNAARARFTRRLIETQEHERKRIALELHDSIGQSLVVIRNRALIGLKRSKDPEQLEEQMREISDASSAALQETREVAHNLHPYQITHLGLSAALNSLLDDVADSSGITIERDIAEIRDELAPDVAINVYRIAQESLNNIVRHSEGDSAKITLSRSNDQFLFEVEDNGIGFQIGDKNEGLGLRGLRERAEMIGATLTVNSRSGKGTRLTLYFPFKTKSDAG